MSAPELTGVYREHKRGRRSGDWRAIVRTGDVVVLHRLEAEEGDPEGAEAAAIALAVKLGAVDRRTA